MVKYESAARANRRGQLGLEQCSHRQGVLVAERQVAVIVPLNIDDELRVIAHDRADGVGGYERLESSDNVVGPHVFSCRSRSLRCSWEDTRA
jgi:hypothetical protein